MADPNRRNDIITAAKHVFATEGYHKASIKKIAKEANLKSSALIYWYFENKEELLTVVLKEGVPLANLGDMPDAFFELPPDVVLPKLLQMHLAALQNEDIQKLAKILIPELLRNEEMREQFTEMIDPAFGLIRRYLSKQVENGRFRPHDTAVSARLLLATTVYFGMNQMMIPNLDGGLPHIEEYISESVQIFIHGLKNGEI